MDENSSIADGFQYDLMIILDNGILFGPPCILLVGLQCIRTLV